MMVQENSILQNLSLYTVAGILLVALFTACSTSEHTADDGGHHNHHHHEPAEQTASDLEQLYWSRLEKRRANFTQADIDFMNDMIIHHAQALIMSRMAPENGASPVVQTLAARIINAQHDEIATMQKWLKDRGQPAPIVTFDGIEMIVEMEQPPGHDHHHEEHGHHGHHDMSHHDDMPGMLTHEQLKELKHARGQEFDRLFLTYMIEHHEGAVIMVRDLFDAEGAANDAEAFDLASDIHAEQITEINRMQLMLDQMAGQQ